MNRARRAGFQLRHIWEPAFTGCVLAEFAKKANEIAHEMSALAGGESRGRWKDGLILEGRGGAGNEGTGSDLTGDG